MDKGDYAGLKRNLTYRELLFQKFCLCLKERKLVCNYYKVMWNHILKLVMICTSL